jgi:hypothetical protein
MLVVIMGMLIFSGLAYVSEKDEEETKFISMPQVLHPRRRYHIKFFSRLFFFPFLGALTVTFLNNINMVQFSSVYKGETCQSYN